MAIVKIAQPLRRFVAGNAQLEIEGETINDILVKLDQQYPGCAQQIKDNKNHIKLFINVYINNKNIRAMQNLATAVGEEDTVLIFPAVAGG